MASKDEDWNCESKIFFFSEVQIQKLEFLRAYIRCTQHGRSVRPSSVISRYSCKHSSHTEKEISKRINSGDCVRQQTQGRISRSQVTGSLLTGANQPNNN